MSQTALLLGGPMHAKVLAVEQPYVYIETPKRPLIPVTADDALPSMMEMETVTYQRDKVAIPIARSGWEVVDQFPDWTLHPDFRLEWSQRYVWTSDVDDYRQRIERQFGYLNAIVENVAGRLVEGEFAGDNAWARFALHKRSFYPLLTSDEEQKIERELRLLEQLLDGKDRD